MDPIERIDQAFLQLWFAIKLMNYLEKPNLRREDRDKLKRDFDTDTIILLARSNLACPEDAFDTYDDLIIAAQNNYVITLGFSALVLDSSIQQAGWSCNSEDLSERGQLRSLIYMVRCAFAHDMMMPVWNIKSSYRRILEIPCSQKSLRIDLRELNGKSFNDEHIGGVEGWFEIRDRVRTLLKGEVKASAESRLLRSMS